LLRGRRFPLINPLIHSTNPDLSAFRRHGGRLIIKENGNDFAQSPNSRVARMGQNSEAESHHAPLNPIETARASSLGSQYHRGRDAFLTASFCVNGRMLLLHPPYPPVAPYPDTARPQPALPPGV
jgi:hypothetical protein